MDVSFQAVEQLCCEIRARLTVYTEQSFCGGSTEAAKLRLKFN